MEKRNVKNNSAKQPQKVNFSGNLSNAQKDVVPQNETYNQAL
jgi:hypothetical protein